MGLAQLDKNGDAMPHLSGTGSGVTGSSDSSLTIVATDAIINKAQTATWTGAHVWDSEDNGTTSVPSLMTAQHRNNAAGTPAAGYGVSFLFKLDSSARTLRTAVELDAVWSTATDGAEVSSFALKTLIAGASTETVRFGTGAALPDTDFAISMGRALIDSRVSDRAYFSHRDMTSTSQYAVQQAAAGGTQINAPSGQSLILANNATQKMKIDSTGIAFYAGSTVAQQTGPVLNITNNVTSGGTDGTIANYTDLTVYANDAAAIRNNIYQLARTVKFCSDGLRAYSLLT